MPDYGKMYAILCGAASDAVDFIRERNTVRAEYTLLSALRRTEEMYLAAEESDGKTEEKYRQGK